VGSGLFPPLQIVDWQGVKPEETYFMISFEASGEHALEGSLQLWFTVQLLDQASVSISISAAASLSPASLEPVGLIPERSVDLYSGPFDETAVEDRISFGRYAFMGHQYFKQHSGLQRTPGIVTKG
jgi:hypothetical protein